MKGIYLGYEFDTDKSVLVAETQYQLKEGFLIENPENLICKITLYREKETGYYFMVDMSYAYVMVNHIREDGYVEPVYEITGLSLYDAKKWGMQYMTDENYIMEFGLPKDAPLNLNECSISAPKIETYVYCQDVDDLDLSDI